jgi:hypothetical protein
MNNSEYPTARKNGLVVQEMPDEVLVYDLDSNKAHCLNQTAASVWKSCDGKTSVADIAEVLASNTGSRISEDLVWLAIDQLSENNLLEQQIRADFAGRSRREVIKKIGLASVIAIPVIASLVAPQSALAASSCRCNSQNPSECAPQVPAGCGALCGPNSFICGGA